MPAISLCVTFQHIFGCTQSGQSYALDSELLSVFVEYNLRLLRLVHCLYS